MSEETFPNECLIRARSLKGWSQEALAREVGTVATMVSRWERGKNVPSPYFRERLCAVLGQTPEQLGFVGASQQPQPSTNVPLVCLVASHDDADHPLISHLEAMLLDKGITLRSSTHLKRQGSEHPQKALREAVRGAQALVVIISPFARTSRYVREALETARTYQRPVYGVWIKGEQLQACFPGDSGEVSLMIDARKGHDSSLLNSLVVALDEICSIGESDTLELPMGVPDPMPPIPSSARGDRERLLRRVRSHWIEGVLDHSLHGAALIALELQKRPESVVYPWDAVLPQPKTTPYLFPSGARIIDVYDAADGELLILGDPGAGKTTLLLELTRELLSRAEQDESHPLPFVFNLSSWATKRQGLAEWLVEELNTKYGVPHKLGRTLVEKDEILPLLDGLDEVDTNDRTACIEAINSYRQERGLSSLVVCSRSTDYLAQATRVQLGCAVEIQPLTDQQIDDYLTSAGEPLEALRMALRQDASLREITSTPLMLSVLTLTYHDSSVEELPGASSPADRQHRVFEHYIEHVLKRRGSATSYPSQHTIGWLTWLAQQMKRHGQTIFYIERMQPDWLPESWSYQLYYRVLVRLGIGIVSGLVICLTLAIAIGLFIGTGLGLLRSEFVIGLVGALVGGLAGGLVMALTNRIETEIQPAEVVVWSWHRLVQVKSFKKRLVVGISSGLTFGMLMGLALVLSSSSAVTPRIVFLMLGVTLAVVAIVMLAGGLTSGVSTTLQNERDLTLPNQGMRQSARNSIRIGIVSALVGGSISIGIFFLILKLIGATFARSINELCLLLLCGAIGGTISGLVVGLPNGGIASIQHLVLRVLLWRSHLIPWNYSRFLDYAAEHILLSKVGGGYMFIHRLLLDHFGSRRAVLSTDGASQIHPDKS
jgi:transcriptional regulator with XRE-family HTH domain